MSGNIAYASSVNNVIDDLYTLQNGNINSANLNQCAVGAVNIEASAVTTSAVRDNAIQADKADPSIVFIAEVF